MTDLLRIRSGGRDQLHTRGASWPTIAPLARRAASSAPSPASVSSPASAPLATPTFSLDEAAPRPPLADAAAVGLLCLLALYVATAHGWSMDDDGASVVPIIALVGIATAAIRRRPGRTEPPVRVVSLRLALLVAMAGGALVATTLLAPQPPTRTIGPMVSLALVGAYLALWGFRSLALLRTVTLLSFLTWAPVAEALHDIVRSSLDQPSELIYQRLATLSVFGVDDEPWTLFTAVLHRGTLVVITTVVLGIAASRWRVTPRMLVDLAVSAVIAVVVHHVIVLSSPVDDYDPTDTAEVATNPVLEVAIAVVAVLVLTAIRRHRHRGLGPAGPATNAPHARDEVRDRDPVIFAADRTNLRPLTAVLLLVGVAPLLTLAVVG